MRPPEALRASITGTRRGGKPSPFAHSKQGREMIGGRGRRLSGYLSGEEAQEAIEEIHAETALFRALKGRAFVCGE